MNKDTKYLNKLASVNPSYPLPLDFDSGTGFALNNGKNAWSAADFRNVVISAIGTGTITVYGSIQETPPDFSAASTKNNAFAVIVLADYSLATNQYVTSLVVSSSTKIAELNTNLLSWFAIHRSATTVDVIATQTNNV